MIFMQRKGISPLIATVLLIAFTMAIAGIMASWATTFVTAKINETETQSSSLCSGSLNADARIINGTGYVVVTVLTAAADLSDWKGYIYYDNPAYNEVVALSNASRRISPGSVATFNFTNSSADPITLRIWAGNCPLAVKNTTIIFIS